MVIPIGRLPGLCRDYLTAGLDILYPATCAFCRNVCQEKPQFPGICRQCLSQLPLRYGHAACLNWREMTDDQIPDPAVIYVPAYYQGTMRQALLQLKFGDAPDVAPALSALMISLINRLMLDIRAVMAVPLHPSRLRERGYNQAALLTSQIAQRLHLPDWSPGIRRIRATNRQSEQPDRYERWSNLSGAFNLNPDFIANRLAVAGFRSRQPVLLVDDILTTGVTITEAARPIWRAGLPVVGLVAASDHRNKDTR